MPVLVLQCLLAVLVKRNKELNSASLTCAVLTPGLPLSVIIEAKSN